MPLPLPPGAKHLRLVAFFVVLALLGAFLGVAWIRRLGGPLPGGAAGVPTEDAARVLAIVVTAVSATAFAGIFLHRLYVLPWKQREIERYLARIEREWARAQALLEGAVDMLLVVDPKEGRVRECNALARETLGIEDPVDGAAPVRLSERLAEPHRERFREAVAEAVGRPRNPVDVAEVRVLGAGGRAFPARARIVAVEVEDEQIVEVTLSDLSLQRELERRVQLGERLGSLGLLTASVAHEINNPLEGIGNYLALLDRPELDVADRRRYVEKLREGFGRIRDLARDLLRFARSDEGGGSADLARVVERAIRIASGSRDCAGVRFERSGLERPLAVGADAGQLEQVVIHLLLNAGRAMGGEGTVEIAAEAGADGSSVDLVVADHGPGIPEADLDRIFDPFFTTRAGAASGAGSGLGLAIVYGIVRANGGSIAVVNRREGGAEFAVRLQRGMLPSDERS